MSNNLAVLIRELDELREPAGGYDAIADRFSNIAVLDHERKTQYRRVVSALQIPDRETTENLLRGIQQDFVSYGRLIVESAQKARDLDGYGKTLRNAIPISLEDQALYDRRCSELRARVIDALLASGHVAHEPEWLL